MASPVELLLPLLDGVKKSGKGWKARCPAHDDVNPSLSIKEGREGRAVVHCFTNKCSADAIMTSVGLSLRDLFPDHANHARVRERAERRIVATYDYVDKSGNISYQVLRYEPKTFRQRRPDGHGGWKWNMDGVRRVLYNLPRVIEAVAEERIIVIVEGEGKVEALKEIGVVATTSVGGASGWSDDYQSSLRGASVVIVPDNDAAGRHYEQQVARSLQGVAARIRTVALPGLSDKEDVVDWFRAGGTKEKLCALIETSSDISVSDNDDEEIWTPVDGHTEAAVSATKNVPKTQSQLVIELVAEDGHEFWHTPDKEAFVTFTAERCVHERVRSCEYSDFLSLRFYQKHGRSPTKQGLNDALATLRSRAHHNGAVHSVYVRVAELDDVLYIDLGDSSGAIVRIDAAGWEIVESLSNIRFRRPAGMAALPRPIRGGSMEQLLPFVNVSTEEAWTLLVVWILNAIRATGPYPILVFQGEQGSAKSSTVRILSDVIDPSICPVRSLPKDERDFFIHGSNNQLLNFDNISRLADWKSDALCRISTGGGYATRTLYTNGEETVFNIQRPVTLNGIEDFLTRADLADRAIVVVCPSIPDNKRRDERSLRRDFELARPSILGAILDAISGAMRIPSVTLESSPRMADFARWGVAVEKALHWEPGRFLRAYEGNRTTVTEQAVEYDQIANFVRELAGRGEWLGTVGDLLKELNEAIREELRVRSQWPADARKLSDQLTRMTPNLRRLGVLIEFLPRSNRGRRIRITTEIPTAPAWLSAR